ncbi:DUF5071 domain-containing protein [Marinospirillum sp. MEB164]|uniref:DUF5071 domain-containing protein n=1 Tax=Marinospirillum alkalitolerans TaxID=3123374 RepID=A0ABW8PZZ0_9GAMM
MIEIQDKSDQQAVDAILALGYPENKPYIETLLAWTCDPNWPIAGSIYAYLSQLGKQEVASVLRLADQVDHDWRYSLITQLIAGYDDETLAECVTSLKRWAAQTGSQECDFEALRLLAERALIDPAEIAAIAKRNLFVYNLWIKETLDAAGQAIYAFPLRDHHL